MKLNRLLIRFLWFFIFIGFFLIVLFERDKLMEAILDYSNKELKN